MAVKYTSAVYAIVNSKNGKLYIGSSTEVLRRLRLHKRSLDLEQHHNTHLQKAYSKDKNAFMFVIIQRVYTKDLLEREQYWMDYFLSYDHYCGYNISEYADSPALGTIRNKKTREKISNALKGRKLPEHVKAMLAEANKGRKVSQETRDKISKAQLGSKNHRFGKINSTEHNMAISKANKGRKVSKATRKKLSLLKKGKTTGWSYWTGKNRSEETKRKISETKKGTIITKSQRQKYQNQYAYIG